MQPLGEERRKERRIEEVILMRRDRGGRGMKAREGQSVRDRSASSLDKDMQNREKLCSTERITTRRVTPFAGEVKFSGSRYSASSESLIDQKFDEMSDRR